MINSAVATPIFAFAGVAAVLVVTPGVGTTFLISTVVDQDKRAGYLTALGMVLGAAIHATIAAVGTAILLRRLPQALTWVALVGGTFIIALGLRGLVRAVRGPGAAKSSNGLPPGRHSVVVTGVLIALSNAPIPLFYFVVVPRYIPPGMPRIAGAVLLSIIHLSMAGAWMVTLVTLLGRVVETLRRPLVQRSLQVATGVVLIVLGAQAVVDATR